jgi:hypothetical protein
MPAALTPRHNAWMDSDRPDHDQVIVEIAYVLISSALLLSVVVVAEWMAWRAFSLRGSGWRSVGDTVMVLVLIALVERATRLLRRLGAQSGTGANS